MQTELEQVGKPGHRRWQPGIGKECNDSGILSSAGHEKPCMNPAGPSAKAKYSWETDSEPVPWGKGEKNPDEGSEIDPETLCLQAVEAPHESDRVPFA